MLDGFVIGEACLNVPETLNSLSLDMVRTARRRLARLGSPRGTGLRVDRAGAGDRRFCAGGDVQALYRSIRAGDAYAFEFFEEEYRLDYYIHTYPKPVVTLGHGIVMGGGLGNPERVPLSVPHRKIAARVSRGSRSGYSPMRAGAGP